MQKILTFLKKKDLYLGISRYALGLMMLPYAISKILKTQFIVLPNHTWQQPLEKLSGISLAWSFLGYSPWFQMMVGFLELIPALLLLFRRTTLLGAILMLPMTLNVFLINEAFNMWEATKMISMILLLLNIIVLIFEWQNIKSILLIIFNKERKFKINLWETIVNVIVISAIIFLSSHQLLDYLKQKDEFTGDWYNRHPNEWVLQSETTNGKPIDARIRKMYFGAYGTYEEFVDDHYNEYMKYKLSKKNHTIEILDRAGKLKEKYNYSFPTGQLLELKSIDAAKKDTLIQVFKKRIINQE